MATGNGKLPKFLADLTEAVQAVEQIPEDLFDKEQIREGDVVIGQISEPLARLYVVLRNTSEGLERDLKRLRTDCRKQAQEPDPEHENRHYEIERNMDRGQFLKQIFWRAVREEFPSIVGCSIGICAGGKLVKHETEREEIEVGILLTNIGR